MLYLGTNELFLRNKKTETVSTSWRTATIVCCGNISVRWSSFEFKFEETFLLICASVEKVINLNYSRGEGRYCRKLTVVY